MVPENISFNQSIDEVDLINNQWTYNNELLRQKKTTKDGTIGL